MIENSLLVQSIKDYAIFMLNPQGIIISWNEGAKRIKGYLPNEIIGKHFSIFYTQEDLEINKPANELKIALATGKYEEEGWRLRKDGSGFWANVVITAAYDESGKHIGFSKITRDLTERKSAEEKLKRSEERYRLLVEQVEDYGIFMLDIEGNIVSWNEGAARINGYETSEILGKNFSVFYPREDIISQKPQRELEIAAKDGKYEEEGWRIRKNGNRFWANVVITAIYNDEGKLFGYAKVTRDLTERKKAETELRESFEKQRLLAEELKLTNNQLVEANRQLEQFASVASHDLKEPLRKIITFADLRLNDKTSKLSEQGEKNFSKVIESARRMSRMIEDVLSFSFLAQKQEFQTISLQAVLDETLELLDQPIKEKKAIISSDNLPEIKVIPAQMRQLFQNLISNSLKFSRKEVQPNLSVTHKFLNGKEIKQEGIKSEVDYLQIRFEDNGIGFNQKDGEKIFELFKRLHNRNEYSGTGIGLAIVKKIVDNHDGFISAESNEQKGAGFTILLPVN
jgi:PAS domain S-box-containing protein